MSPRGKWIVHGVWIALVAAVPIFAPSLAQVTETGDEQFLPTGAEATRALQIAEEVFRGMEPRQSSWRIVAQG